jgi:hypothetical protein
LLLLLVFILGGPLIVAFFFSALRISFYSSYPAGPSAGPCVRAANTLCCWAMGRIILFRFVILIMLVLQRRLKQQAKNRTFFC